MSILPMTSAEPGAPDAGLGPALDRLWAELPRLRQTGLAGDAVGGFADHVAALRFLLHAGPDRPLLVGLVGGASCGKSTLFDSLVGRTLSRIHYQPHSSLGPIVWVHRQHRPCLTPEAQPRRFLADLAASQISDRAEPATGAVDAVALAFHDDPQWQRLALLDLPDISSESARREGWLVRRLIPWMDLVIWIVDPNDYLFEDQYIDLIEQVARFGQRSIVVVNDIHGQVEPGNAVLQERIDRFGPDAWFLLPPLDCSAPEPYPLFRSEPGFSKLRDSVLAQRSRRPLAPLVTLVRHEAQTVLHSNREWERLVRELAAALTRLVARRRKTILASAPLLSVLPESAQQALERLRKRFSLLARGKRWLERLRVLRNPARAMSQVAFRTDQITAHDLDTEPLFQHLVGMMKDLSVELHRVYLESRLVQQLQQQGPSYEVLGPFQPESLDFKPQLDVVAQHLLSGSQRLLSDASLWKDSRFPFVAGTAGVAAVFFVVESMLGVPGLTLLVGKGVTALVGLLSPELAHYLPMDRIGRLAREARDMLATIFDQQTRSMVAFYTAAGGRYLEPGDPLLANLERLQAEHSLQPRSE